MALAPLFRRSCLPALAVAIPFLVGAQANPKPAAPLPPLSQKAMARALEADALAAYGKGNYPSSAALYLYAIDRGVNSGTTYYNAACSLALSGDGKRAIQYLGKSIDHGYLNLANMVADADLKSLHADPSWPKLLEKMKRAEAKHGAERADLTRAKWVTSDIDLFWRAYDLAQKAPKEERPAIYQREYMDRGSVGLEDFLRVRGVSARGLAAYVDAHPAFYRSIRPYTLEIAKLRPQIRVVYEKMKEMYPESVFDNVYFCIGGFAGGGTVSDNGLLISADMFGSNIPMEGMTDWEKGAFAPAKDIPAMIAHELVHFEQRYASADRSALRRCLNEGIAHFLGYLNSGYLSDREQIQHEWADAHERELWTEFQQDMDGTDTSKWLYGDSGKGVRPNDLGYYMGFRIAQSYYDKAADKKKAIRDMLNIQDFKAFLRDSGYPEKF